MCCIWFLKTIFLKTCFQKKKKIIVPVKQIVVRKITSDIIFDEKKYFKPIKEKEYF